MSYKRRDGERIYKMDDEIKTVLGWSTLFSLVLLGFGSCMYMDNEETHRLIDESTVVCSDVSKMYREYGDKGDWLVEKFKPYEVQTCTGEHKRECVVRFVEDWHVAFTSKSRESALKVCHE